MKSSCLVLDIVKTVAYIEDYCCVLAFSCEQQLDAERYFMLTRPSSQPNGGEALEDVEWALSILHDERYTNLFAYAQLSPNQLIFYFNDDFCLQLNLKTEPISVLQPYVDFVFQDTDVDVRV